MPNNELINAINSIAEELTNIGFYLEDINMKLKILEMTISEGEK